MKHIAIALLLHISNYVVNAQIITVEVDTLQNFEHSKMLSTMQAIETGDLIYTTLFECRPFYDVTFDLDKCVEHFSGYENPIIQVNESTNLVDVIVQEGNRECLIILGETDDGGMIYLYEYHDGEIIKGFFTLDPKITIRDNSAKDSR